MRRSRVVELSPPGLTIESSGASGLNSILERNIHSLITRRHQEDADATTGEKIARSITKFTGSMRFVYVHITVYGSWLALNYMPLPGALRFDPSFANLGIIVSIEAIFLSTFVLINQNRMSAAADERADLDLQITLLSEHELTKVIAMVSAIAEHQGVTTNVEMEVEELKRDIAPEAVLNEIQTAVSLGGANASDVSATSP